MVLSLLRGKQMFNLTLIEFNSKTEKLEITQKGNKVEIDAQDMVDILKYDVFKPFLKLVKEEEQQ